jgi:hypothetical protein
MAPDPADTLQADPAQTLASVRAELAKVRSSVARIERDLGLLDATQRGAGGGGRERPDRYLQVLVDVYDRGGRHGLDSDGFAAVGERHGYDRRGLGGFFTGGRAPLRRDHERILLTPYGEQLVDLYLQRLAP